MSIPHFKLAQICRDSYAEHTVVIDEVECLIRMEGGYTVIAFRGTEVDNLTDSGGLRDIIRDLRVFPSYDKRVGLAHSGFLKGARSIVDEYLFLDLAMGEPVIVTGHSLGGGLAVCAAGILKAEGYNVKELVTFGCPRTLFAGSLKCLDGVKISQYRNGHDFVTTVPWKFWGYRHAAKQIQLGIKSERRTWADHPIDKYINSL